MYLGNSRSYYLAIIPLPSNWRDEIVSNYNGKKYFVNILLKRRLFRSENNWMHVPTPTYIISRASLLVASQYVCDVLEYRFD